MDAAVYLRISQDRTGLQAGIQRQQEDCLARAAKLGFAKDADTRKATIERAVSARWRGIPASEAALPAWAMYVAQEAASANPDVLAARKDAAAARRTANATLRRHLDESTTLHPQLLGTTPYRAVTAHVQQLQERSTADRRYLTQLDTLPPAEASKLARERAAVEHARRQTAEDTWRAVQERESDLDPSPSRDPGRYPSASERGHSL